jgi:hypothetical protein
MESAVQTGLWEMKDPIPVASSRTRKLPSVPICPADSRFFVFVRLHLARGEEPCPYRPVPNPQVCGDLPQALALRL